MDLCDVIFFGSWLIANAVFMAVAALLPKPKDTPPGEPR